MNSSLFTIPDLALDSRCAQLIVELEPLRTKTLRGTTPPWVFFGLKNLFQTIGSVTSAGIEGNKTTIAGYIEAARSTHSASSLEDSIKMIMNLEEGISFIESINPDKLTIDRDFIHELHRIVVNGLDNSPNGEGDTRPGAWRLAPRIITHSNHVLPAPADIREYMDNLVLFINTEKPHQLDLIKIAMVHHRFVWIHPYGNGNGRVIRLLTYAMLAKAGYIDKQGTRLLDPNTVFGMDKMVYYDKLAGADDLTKVGTVAWCEFMLDGLANEVRKIDRLLDGDFSQKQIIQPAINYAFEKQRINKLEKEMLTICSEKKVVSASDFAHLFPANISRVNISLAIRKLRDQNLLVAEHENARKYTLSLNYNPITVGILRALDENGFLPPLSDGLAHMTT